MRLVGEDHETAILRRETITAGATLDGPLIIEEAHSTLLIPPDWRVSVHPTGALIADRQA